MPKFYSKIFRGFILSRALFFLCCLFFFKNFAAAQCPPNIDFELGDFSSWECWIGTTAEVAGKNVITWNPNGPVRPVNGRHTIYNSVPGAGRDPYGNFPINCPNGSGTSIKLGNNLGGAQAEGVSYTFTIPAGQNKFNLIYNYAVVFQDPGHAAHQQPQLQIEIENLTDGDTIGCSSFSFLATSGLPGFFQSSNPQGNTPVWCKNWSAASINLDGNAGKTIRLFFKTADCVFNAHFGYAYIDVNTQCSSAFTGATFCPDDTAVNVVGPYGYQNYEWWDGTFTRILGTSQSLTLSPPPLAGDSVKVVLTPFAGYGCIDTITANLWDTLTVVANAGIDKETCDNNPIRIGAPPEPGRIYKWTPAAGLNDASIANPLASPTATTTYTLTVTNSGGGCVTQDVVNVGVDVLSDSLEQIGPSSYCTTSGQTVRLRVLPHDAVQWYRNGAIIPGAVATDYVVTQTGAYYAVVSSTAGCTRTTAIKQINIWESPVIGFNTPNAAQCFVGNSFTFNNTSTISNGVLQYEWTMGDGRIYTTRNALHSYAADGNYRVRLLVTAPGGCVDSSFTNIIVNPTPYAEFSVDEVEKCSKGNNFIFTNKSKVTTGALTYVWSFGDGSFNSSNNITHSYATPGVYAVRLTSTATTGGCVDDSVVTVTLHPSPTADFSTANFNQCFPGHSYTFTNNTSIFSGGTTNLWSFGDGSYDTTDNPTYLYKTHGTYTVKMVATSTGGYCKDSVSKVVELYPVPYPDFAVQPVCQDIRVPVINRTNNNSTSIVYYYWDFGNGHLDNAVTPAYAYTIPGAYALTLRISTAQCPVTFNTLSKNIVIEKRIDGITYTDKTAFYNYPLALQARNIGNNATWSPAINLNQRFSYSPIFKGITPQQYTIQLKTPTGCVTVDTQYVKTEKKIEIYVPNGFTPGNDFTNERLRPVLVGFTKVNYFRIYDRWGKLLFTSNSDLLGWDGKLNGNPVLMQTVVWMIEAVDVDGKVHSKQGSTVVIR
jgi:gliding motility-associated-like protein